MLKKSLEKVGLIKKKEEFGDFKLNERALLDNLKWSEKQLKDGVPIDLALNEANLAFGRMSEMERNDLRGKLEPYPTRKFIRKLDRIIEKYDK